MNAISPRTRGLIAVLANGGDPVALVKDIKAGFEKHRDDTLATLREVQNQIADVANKMAGIEMNGPIAAGSTSISAAQRNELNGALRSYLKSGDTSGIEAMAVQASMSVGSDPDGGYSVLPAFSNEITRTVKETSPLRDLARVVTINTDAFEELVDRDDVGAAWVGEAESRPATDTAQLGKLSIPVHEQYAMPKVTRKLLDDSAIDIGAWLTGKVADKFARAENAAFVVGDGLKKPRGFLSYPTSAAGDDSRPWGTIQHVDTGVSGGFAAPDAAAAVSPADVLVSTVYALKSGYRPGAWWFMNSATAAAVRKLKDADGRFIWTDSLQQGQPPMLLGYPVRILEDMPAIAANSLPIAFGDPMRFYTIVERFGIRVLRDELTAKPHVLFYCFRRLGGDVTNFEALKLVRFGTA